MVFSRQFWKVGSFAPPLLAAGVALGMRGGAAEVELPLLLPRGPRPAEVVDVVAVPADPARQILAASLQGLVNGGASGRVYLLQGHWAPFWLDVLRRGGHLSRVRERTFEQFLSDHIDSCRTVVLTDPAVPATVNVATMLASLEHGVVADPEPRVLLPAEKPVLDLRGRWGTNEAAYRWALRELLPRLNPRILAHVRTDSGFLRDYLVQQRVFCLWVTAREKAAGTAVADHDAEYRILLELLAETPANIPVMGFWNSVGEYRAVGVAGEHGKITVPSDFAPNLSLLSGIPVDIQAHVARYRERLRERACPILSPDRVYISFAVTESGDAPAYHQFRQHEVWQDPARGSVPINWAFTPLSADVQPPIAAYYLDAATPCDYLYPGLSGIGYTHPYRAFMSETPDPEAAWADYLSLTRQGMSLLGAREIGVYVDALVPYDRALGDPVTRRFLRAIPELDLIVMGMHCPTRIAPPGHIYCLENPPRIVAHLHNHWPADWNEMGAAELVDWLADEVRRRTPAGRPAFMQVCALSWAYGPTEIRQVLDRLGAEYAPVTLPEFTRLHHQWRDETRQDGP